MILESSDKHLSLRAFSQDSIDPEAKNYILHKHVQTYTYIENSLHFPLSSFEFFVLCRKYPSTQDISITTPDTDTTIFELLN